MRCGLIRGEALIVAKIITKRRFQMDLPMRDDLKVGNTFPDFELPDHTGMKQGLSRLLRGFPGALIFDRGHF
jgi:hypothetical protein